MKATSVNIGPALKGIGWIAAAGMLALSGMAAEPPRETDFRLPQSSYYIIGKKVVNSQDETLGRVKDLAIDLENGRLVEVIVATPSGFLGLTERTAAVPPGAMWYDLEHEVVRLNMSKDKFMAAPDFEISNWARHSQSKNVAEVYRYYGQVPYFAPDGQDSPSGNTATEPLGYVQRNSKLLGLPVKNLQDQPLGKLESVQFNLADGRVFHVIVLAPGFAKTKSVIPTRALRYNAAHDALLLDVSTEAFKDEPRFKWTYAYGRKGEFQQETYTNAKVAANDGVNTRQNVQAGIVETYTPLAQGSSYDDVDKTYRIYSTMRADDNLSENAQSVEVGTVNGRVTLRGHVNTEEGKHTIGVIAGRAGRPENVSNLLEVKPLPVSGGLVN